MTRRTFIKSAAVLAAQQSLRAQTVNYHYVMCVGQSLMLGGNGGTGLTTTQPYSNVIVGSGGFSSLVNTSLEDPSVPCMNQIRSMAGSGYDMVRYNAGLGSSDYANLKKNGTTSAYADSMTNADFMPAKSVAAGKTYEFSAIMCMHGEADTNPTLGSVYTADLAEWRRDYNIDLQAISGQTKSIPFFTDQTSVWNLAGGGRTQPLDSAGNYGVSQSQYIAARDNPGFIYCVAPIYPYPYADNIHLTNSAYRVFGETFGKWMYRVLVLGNRWAGLVPRSITRSGAVITVRYWMYGGASLVIDTTLSGGDKGASKGYEFTDDSGTTPTISSVSVSSDTATITLSGTPTGGSQRLQYAYTGTLAAGGGSADQAHGNIRNDDSTSGYATGSPLYDWGITFDEPIGFSWDYPNLSTLSVSGQTTFGGGIQR